jgi:hypothetical protein
MGSDRRTLTLLIVATCLACRGRDGSDNSDTARRRSADRAQNVASACRDVDPASMPDASGPTPRDGYTPLATRDSLLRRIEAAEQKWRAARPPSYMMTVVAACFCRDRGQPIELVVRGDSVVASRDTTGQQSWPDDWRAGLHVAGLFREARQFVCDSTRTTRVTLDPRLGYPRLLTTQSRLEMSDSDREYRVLSFVPEQTP